jgi:hypothetical protein
VKFALRFVGLTLLCCLDALLVVATASRRQCREPALQLLRGLLITAFVQQLRPFCREVILFAIADFLMEKRT